MWRIRSGVESLLLQARDECGAATVQGGWECSGKELGCILMCICMCVCLYADGKGKWQGIRWWWAAREQRSGITCCMCPS